MNENVLLFFLLLLLTFLAIKCVLSLGRLFTPGGLQTPVGKKPAGRPSTSPQVGSGRGAASSSGKVERDPNAPKKPSNAFFMFCQSHRTSIQVECLQSEMTGHHDLTKLMAKKWKELPADEKKVCRFDRWGCLCYAGFCVGVES